MDRMKIRYREVKKSQQEDLRANLMEYNIYRRFSSPFTYLFLRLCITPNQITLYNFFVCLFGGIFLSFGTYISMIVGMLLFLLFKVLDDCDGEVARLQKSYSMEGILIDRIAHYLNSLSLGLGLGIGFYKLYGSEIYILIGIVFTFGVIIEQVIIDLLKATLRKKVIHESFNKAVKKEKAQKIETTTLLNEGRSFSDQSIFSKFFSVYPLQGLLSGDRFYTMIITILVIGEYFMSIFGLQLVVDGIALGFAPIYLAAISISKIIWITGFIYRLDKTRYITKF